LPKLNGITPEQREDITKMLDPIPGKRMVSAVVSSDESGTDEDGSKCFCSKILPGRSSTAALVMAELNTLAKKAADTSGTSLFKRLPGRNVSERVWPDETPKWMKE
jgi:hypothetical protein